MDSVGVELWWADLSAADISSAITLPLRERERLTEVSDQAERGRRLVGELLLQRAVRHSRRLLESETIEIDRTCAECGAQHGRPVVADGRGPHVSVAHSGLVIAVATCRGTSVGVDVERLPAENVSSRAVSDWVEREARIKAGVLGGEEAEVAGGSFLAVVCPFAGYIAGLAVSTHGHGVMIDLIEHPLPQQLP